MRRHPALLFTALLSALAGTPAVAGNAPAAPANRAPAQATAKPQEIDRSALWAKQKAAAALGLLVRSRRGTAEEPDFLLRLADVQHEVAAIEYRVAFATAGPGVAPSLAAYQAALQASMVPLNDLITRFPNNGGIPRAYYLRGKSQSELSHKDDAIADFSRLVDTWPKAPETSLAYPSLWDLYLERKDYPHLVECVHKRGLNPADKLYPTALEKLSWAHYYLNEIPAALKFAVEGAAHIRRIRTAQRDYAGELEKIMGNIALFYATGLTRKVPGLLASDAIAYLKRVFPDRDFDRAVIQYAYGLRVNGLDAEVEILAATLAAGDYSDEVKAEALLVSLENQLNKRDWKSYAATAGKLTYLAVSSPAMRKDGKAYAKTIRILNDAVGPLQAALQNQNAQNAALNAAPASQLPVTHALMATYRILLDAAPDRAARAGIHYNMAELATRLADHVSAAQYFDLASREFSPSAQAKLWRDASYRYLGSVYEVMKLRKLLPDKLAAVPISTPSREVPSLVAGWIARVDSFAAKAPAPLEKGVEAYLFESARLEYAAARIERALKRLDEFALARPTSEFAIPAAALVMDTYVASAHWAKANATANAYLAVAAWKTTPFSPRLMQIWCDTDYKLAEDDFKAGKHKDALARSETFLKSPIAAQSKRRADFLELAANSALTLKDRATALKYFEPLRAEHPERRESSATAALLAGMLAEEAIEYPKAVQEYVHYLKIQSGIPGADETAVQNARDKALLLSWVSESPALLSETMRLGTVCPPKRERACAAYRLRLDLTRPERELDLPSLRAAAKRALNPTEPDRAAWAALALRKARSFPALERLSLLEAAADGWGKLDPLLAIASTKSLLGSASDAFAEAGASARAARVSVNKAAIDRRVKLMDRLASRLASAARLPWLSVQLASLRETALLFKDFSQELGAIPAPAGLTGEDLKAYRGTIDTLREPFDRKAADTIQAAMTLAAREGTESAEVRRISPETPPLPIREMIAETLAWPYDATNRPNAANLVEAFRKAIAAGQLARAGYLIQEARRTKEVEAGFVFIMEGALLANAHAVPEALAALASARKDVEARRKPPVYLALIAGRYAARDYAGCKGFLYEIGGVDRLAPSPAWLPEAAKWAIAERVPAGAPAAAPSGKAPPAPPAGELSL